MHTLLPNLWRGLCLLAVGAAGVAFATDHVRLGGALLILWSVCELIALFRKAPHNDTTPDDGVPRKRDTRAPFRR
jgi:hypothetical protein